jgi:hypothetical protein
VITSEVAVARAGQEVCRLKGLKTESLKERLGGLLVLKPLRQQELLWISPCNAIHTFGMTYPLDLVYLDKDNVVRHLAENIRPWRMHACLRARATLELQAGMLKQLGIQKGDTFQWLG